MKKSETDLGNPKEKKKKKSETGLGNPKENKKKKKHESETVWPSMEASVECIKKDVASIREDLDNLIPLVDSVHNLKTMVNSLQSSVDLILKPPYAKTPWSPSSSDEYYQRDTLFASGMHPSIKESAIKDFFAVVGQVEVEFDTEEHEHEHGKEATIRFESDEQATKGLKLKGNQCFGRPLYLRRFPNSLYTIYVKGFDTSLPEHEIKVQLIEHFSRTTDAKGLYFRRDKEGLIRGAYINMIDDPQIVQILDQTLIKGRKLTVESLQLRKAAKVTMLTHP